MKASKIQTFLIVCQSLYITAQISVLVLLRSIFYKNIRKYADKLAYYWAHKLFKIIKLSHKVFDPYHLKLDPARNYIIMSNHSSLYDIPLIFASLPGTIRMIAKKELFKVPIWGRAMRISEFISIDRKNKRQAVLDLKEARKKMESGVTVWIAPEGTRSRTGNLLPFKKGGFVLAKQTDAIIIPVGIIGAAKILPPKTFDFNIRESVEIHIGKPIDSSKYSFENIPQLMKDVEESIRDNLELKN